MRRCVPVLLLLASGCALVNRPRVDPRPVASLDRVRAPGDGVCSSLSGIGPAWSADPKVTPKARLGDQLTSSTVTACARARTQAGAEQSLLALTLAFPDGDDRFRPEYWHYELVRQDGLVLEAGTLGPGETERGICILDSCLLEEHVEVALPEPWAAGRYRVRLAHVPTRQRVDLTITLQ